MPRPKAQKRDQQIYKLAAYGAVVTIDYLIDNPPPFFQPQAGVVIVGEHACAPVTAAMPVVSSVTAQAQGHSTPPPLIRNFEVAEDNPEYLAFKASLEAKTGPPAPPDFSPRVVTNDQINAEFEQKVKNETGFGISVPNAAGMAKMAG